MGDQMDFFGPAETEAPLPAADASLLRLAEAIPAHVRFGTSSWTFPGWQGVVYRRRYRSQAAFVRSALYEYARWPLFGTVGIDRSFYAALGADTLRAYAEQLPPGFRCAMKVDRALTARVLGDHRGGNHKGDRRRFNPDFLNPERFNAEVAAPVLSAFADAAGPQIVEIPPAAGAVNPAGFARAVECFLERAHPTLHYAFELRDRRLFTERYLAVLRAHGASHVFNFWSDMPSIGDQLRRVGSPPGDTLVCRLMLPPGERYETLRARYHPFNRIVVPQPAMRADVLRLIDAAMGRDTYILVNNKAEGSAPLTIRALVEALASLTGQR